MSTEIKEREKLELTRDEALDILESSSKFPHDEYEKVSREISDNSRWSIQYELVIKRKSDGKFFRDYYFVGATESQDEGPWECNEPNFTEVFPVEKTVIVYE